MHKQIFWTILLIVVLRSSYRVTKADQQPISKIVLPYISSNDKFKICKFKICSIFSLRVVVFLIVVLLMQVHCHVLCTRVKVW